MWASNMDATTLSETVLAYFVMKTSKPSKKTSNDFEMPDNEAVIQLYDPSCWSEFFLNGLTYMQRWYENIKSLLLYFVNCQSAHFLMFAVMVSPHNDMMRIFLRNAGK